jgi:hypothetical protein
VEVSGSGPVRRLLGQLVPAGPGAIEVRQASPAAPGSPPAARRVEADERGRFTVDAVAAGPVSLVCHRRGRRPVVTAWTTVD